MRVRVGGWFLVATTASPRMPSAVCACHKPLMVLFFSGGYPSYVKSAKPRSLVPGSGVKGKYDSAGVRAERKAPNIGPKKWAGCGLLSCPVPFRRAVRPGHAPKATTQDRQTDAQTDLGLTPTTFHRPFVAQPKVHKSFQRQIKCKKVICWIACFFN